MQNDSASRNFFPVSQSLSREFAVHERGRRRPAETEKADSR